MIGRRTGRGEEIGFIEAGQQILQSGTAYILAAKGEKLGFVLVYFAWIHDEGEKRGFMYYYNGVLSVGTLILAFSGFGAQGRPGGRGRARRVPVQGHDDRGRRLYAPAGGRHWGLHRILLRGQA